MKSLEILILLSIFSVFNFNWVRSDDEDCGPDATYKTDGFACKFTCSPDGVIFDCNTPGCHCNNGDLYFNTQTKTCSLVNCENLDCVDKENEQFFNGCQSGSRDRCNCSKRLTFDCRRGCMCKNGFCREEGKCVPRTCEHPIYKESSV